MNRVIETERLILKPMSVEDAPTAFLWQSDPEVNRYMVYNLYKSVEQTESWIRSLREEDCVFGYYLKATGEIIGSGDVRFDEKHNARGLGYNLARAQWGKGYATEAAKAMLRWAYEELDAHDFCVTHALANEASRNVILKCGFQLAQACSYTKMDGSESFDALFYRLHID